MKSRMNRLAHVVVFVWLLGATAVVAQRIAVSRSAAPASAGCAEDSDDVALLRWMSRDGIRPGTYAEDLEQNPLRPAHLSNQRLITPAAGTPQVGDGRSSGIGVLVDLAQLLAHYGTAEGAGWDDGDPDADGDVDLADLAVLLAVYGANC